MSSSGKIYPAPTYNPPLPVFNPIYFPQSFDTTTTSSGGGGGGGGTNIFPLGLTSGNVITMNGGTGGGGGTGAERTITGLSQIEWADYTSFNPATITGYMVLNTGTLDIGSNTPSSGINVNLQGTTISVSGAISVDNTQSNIGQYTNFNTGIGNGIYSSSPTGGNNVAIGRNSLQNLTTGGNNIIIGSQSGVNLLTGNNNIAFGTQTLISLTSGSGNTAIGSNALRTSTIDINNLAVGSTAGQNLSGNGSNSNSNTFIGVGAGFQQLTGINNVALGYNAGAGSSFPNLNNTICIGGGISPTNDNDIILSNSSNSYIKFSNSGSWCFESFSPGNATLKLLGVGGVAGGLAGVLQIVAGTNGGASLQLQDNGTNPITTSGYGNFASVGGFPFYYSPTYGWSQLASVPTTTFTLTLTPSASGGNTFWTTSPTLTTTLNSNSFNFTFYTNVSNSTTANAPSPLSASGDYIAGTGTAILQKYTNSSITYNGYLFSIVNSNGLPITTTTTITPTPVSNFNVVDSQYFFSSNVNLIFNCIKIN
jgi:hypothetical protein